ncbi:MAG TPA: C25 family cysteine peptidase [Pyrinomonadaceae bacterium]|nr:C25 family cysteine peptidase [Pyrinomonadaceae bacterium]
MFGEKTGVHVSIRLDRQVVSAFLVFSFVLISFSATVKASGDKLRSVSKSAAKQKFPSDVKLDGFQAEIFSGATKLTWKTSFEQNTLGFKIWRDDKGERILVNEEPVAGSLLKVGNGILPAGSEYIYYDRTDSTNVYYWLEAVDINAQSRWFGPVYPQPGFDQTNDRNESETISGLNNSTGGQRQQIDKVDFLTPVLKRNNSKDLQNAENGLLTNDPNALKIEVRNRGIYRVEAQSLAEMGFNAVESANWKLFCGGVEQPLAVNADGSLEFFGQGIDTIQTDANVYWLITDTTAGQRINRVAQNYLPSANYSWTRITAERKDKIYRVSSIINGARENWFGAVVNSTASNQTLNLNDIATTSGQTATVGIDLQGLTNVTHQVSVLLNGVSIGQINFSLYNRIEWTATVALSKLVEGTNTLTLQSLGGSSDVNITEAVRISYPRNLKAQNNRLDFSVGSGQAVKLKGFTSQQVRIFDVTNPLQVTEYTPESRQESDGTYTVTVASASSARVMLAIGIDTQLLAATPLIVNNPSDLRSTQNQAKFLIIAPREFQKSLWDLRNLRNLRGIQTVIVDIEDIYDEFNNGVRSAEAIRSFLQYAKQNWTVKPEFAMFVGEATVDPRNYSGFGGYTYNRVPTMITDTWNMETVSDEMMADFNDDSVGEIAIGRLPAKDQDELEYMLDKIINLEPETRSEVSQRGVYFVSDATLGYDFAAGSRNMATAFPAGIAVNYLDAAGQDPNVLRSSIINRINSGAMIVNYFGHASIGAWTNSQIFRNVDSVNLVNPKKTPFIAMIDCLNGDFAETNMNSLAEAVIKQRGGGANAVWASTGWNTAYDQEFFTRDFYQKVFTGMPLGEAARQTKMLYPITDLRRTYIFFGDPTQPLVTP